MPCWTSVRFQASWSSAKYSSFFHSPVTATWADDVGAVPEDRLEIPAADERLVEALFGPVAQAAVRGHERDGTGHPWLGVRVRDLGHGHGRGVARQAEAPGPSGRASLEP